MNSYIQVKIERDNNACHWACKPVFMTGLHVVEIINYILTILKRKSEKINLKLKKLERNMWPNLNGQYNSRRKINNTRCYLKPVLRGPESSCSLGKQYNKAFSETRKWKCSNNEHCTILSRNAQDGPEQRQHNSDNVGQTEGPASQESR